MRVGLLVKIQYFVRSVALQKVGFLGIKVYKFHVFWDSSFSLGLCGRFCCDGENI